MNEKNIKIVGGEALFKSLTQHPLAEIKPLYQPELEAIDTLILELMKSKAPLIPQLAGHIISSGGKRIRPALTLLCAKLCNYQGQRHIHLATAVEFIHTATLLHDDVVDASELRRGKETANALWGNEVSVLVGDFLLSRAFQLMVSDGSLKVLKLLSDTSAIISEGEVLQIGHIRDINLSEGRYIEIISAKTAALFAAATATGGMVSDQSEEKEQALYQFGFNLGIAFQIVDDALDYAASREKLGKTIGDDFREGKVTLPIILLYKKKDPETRMFLEKTFGDNYTYNEKDLQKLIALLEANGIIEQSLSVAELYEAKAREALNIFPDSTIKHALLKLLAFSINRDY